MKSARLRMIGNTLITISLVSFSAVFGPILVDQLRFALKIDSYDPYNIVSNEFFLNIPAIRTSANISANINPWNEQEYQVALQDGIAHASGSALPGESGTTYLFAHSSDNPLSITRYNTAFYRLHQLPVGEQIRINFRGEEYIYRVTEKITVNPSQTEFLTQREEDQLILQTCSPIGTDWKRLLVIAKPL